MSDVRSGYLYILSVPCLPSDVMKVGRTIDPPRRLSEYPKGATYARVFGLVVDCHAAERQLLEVFRTEYKRFKGNEYFQGDRGEMTRTFEAFCEGGDTPSPMTV